MKTFINKLYIINWLWKYVDTINLLKIGINNLYNKKIFFTILKYLWSNITVFETIKNFGIICIIVIEKAISIGFKYYTTNNGKKLIN